MAEGVLIRCVLPFYEKYGNVRTGVGMVQISQNIYAILMKPTCIMVTIHFMV